MSRDDKRGGFGETALPSAASASPPAPRPLARRGGFGRGFGRGFAPGEKPKDFRGAMRRLTAYIGRHKFTVLAVILLAVGSTLFTILGPKILSRAITTLFDGLVAKLTATGGIDYAAIARTLALLLGVYALSAALNFAQGWLMTGVSQRVCHRMRREISEKINRMPMAYFERNPIGDTLSRITNDIDTLGQGLNQSLAQLIASATTILGVLAVMLTINALMTLVVFLILPVSAALIALVVKTSQKYFRAQQTRLGEINGKIEETFAGHDIVRLFNCEEQARSDFDRVNRQLRDSAWKSQFLSGLMQPIMSFVGNLGYAGVAIVGGVLAFRRVITVGDIQAFILYARNFTHPIMQLAQITNMLQSMAAAAERVFALLAEVEEMPGNAGVPPADEGRPDPRHDASLPDDFGRGAGRTPSAGGTPALPTAIASAVAFDHVHFGYTPDKIIINDFTCRVAPGQLVAIVGPTGAGKTTIVKLLMRFYDVTGGAIRIDGHDIREIPRAALRERIGMVLQDTWLFKGTLMENIRYGRPDATDAEVLAAARAAHVHHFIQTLPGGYQMELNEEATNISQGQKQLLTIARALLAARPILILDEATSSVDTRTETQIQNAMTTLREGRTSFVIAHRLSTIQNADLILVMRDGDIVEQGAHAALLARAGFYAELYNSQFEEATA